jgi:hypothetical protein
MMTRGAVFLFAVTLAPAIPAAGLLLARQTLPAVTDRWQRFEGSWSATGRRQTLPTEGGDAAIVHLSGPVALTSRAGLSRGFRGEAIGFDDGRHLSAGRAVWTDAHGDRIYSVLQGDPLQTGRRITGTITSGTGRYAGLIGDFQLTWQYIVQGENETVQGRTADLEGRFRHGSSGNSEAEK